MNLSKFIDILLDKSNNKSSKEFLESIEGSTRVDRFFLRNVLKEKSEAIKKINAICETLLPDISAEELSKLIQLYRAMKKNI